MNKAKNSLKPDFEKLTASLLKLKRYSFIIFLVLVAATYGFVLLRINSLSHIEPTEDAVNSQVQAAKIPKIDQSVVAQLKSLQDNSVSVKSLFDQERTNPFQENN